MCIDQKLARETIKAFEDTYKQSIKELGYTLKAGMRLSDPYRISAGISIEKDLSREEEQKIEECIPQVFAYRGQMVPVEFSYRRVAKTD
ncbi:MAG: hypothetical protein KC535_01675 [Nanoarchaeota archaeon]|nr:hypothetical protein [Nanoarchaeota archaeon]